MSANALILGIVAVFAIGIAGSVVALVMAPSDSAIPVVTAVLAAAGTLISLLVPLLNQMNQLREDVTTTKDDIRKVEIATNSMKDALVAATAAANLAQGRAEGAASERANPQVDAPPDPEKEDSHGRTT